MCTKNLKNVSKNLKISNESLAIRLQKCWNEVYPVCTHLSFVQGPSVRIQRTGLSLTRYGASTVEVTVSFVLHWLLYTHTPSIISCQLLGQNPPCRGSTFSDHTWDRSSCCSLRPAKTKSTVVHIHRRIWEDTKDRLIAWYHHVLGLALVVGTLPDHGRRQLLLNTFPRFLFILLFNLIAPFVDKT